MGKRIIIGAVLVVAGVSIGAATSQTIQQLRARRAELEKTIAAATAELRKVNAAIAALGKVDALPANYVEENKGRFSATQYEQLKAVKFGGIAIANPFEQAWYEGVWAKAPGATGELALSGRWRFLCRDGNSAYRVIVEDGIFTSNHSGLSQPQPAPIHNTWRDIKGRAVLNAHLLVSLRGIPVYECLWKQEKEPVKPNGVPWWRDWSLTVAAQPGLIRAWRPPQPGPAADKAPAD